jgi:hypothetical protein
MKNSELRQFRFLFKTTVNRAAPINKRVFRFIVNRINPFNDFLNWCGAVRRKTAKLFDFWYVLILK